MQVFEHYRQLARWGKKPLVVTIGNFDGVHLAHHQILHTVVEEAQRRGTCSLIITFRHHPHQVGKNKKKPILTACAHKMVLLQRAGVDGCFLFSFRRGLKKLSAERFLRDVLFRHFPIAALYVGYNFRFGAQRQGTTTLLARVAREYGIPCIVQSPIKQYTQRISSTRIRALVARGALDAAKRLLGRHYSVFATVVRGAGRGTLLGYPTANLDLHSEVIPPRGVYVVTVSVGTIRKKRTPGGYVLEEHFERRDLTGVLNIGYAPTFRRGGTKAQITAEVHILGISENIRGKLLEVTFYAKLRKERAFSYTQQLCAQIQKDTQQACIYFS